MKSTENIVELGLTGPYKGTREQTEVSQGIYDLYVRGRGEDANTVYTRVAIRQRGGSYNGTSQNSRLMPGLAKNALE